MTALSFDHGGHRYTVADYGRLWRVPVQHDGGGRTLIGNAERVSVEDFARAFRAAGVPWPACSCPDRCACGDLVTLPASEFNAHDVWCAFHGHRRHGSND